jgi:hypothetical protein
MHRTPDAGGENEMKAQLKADGVLEVRAETELEMYALHKWSCEAWDSEARAFKGKHVVVYFGKEAHAGVSSMVNDDVAYMCDKTCEEFSQCEIGKHVVDEYVCPFSYPMKKKT